VFFVLVLILIKVSYKVVSI